MSVKYTKKVFFWSFISNAPFWAMYGLLPFILYDLGASPFQITLLVSLKPMVSLLSVYWSDYIHNRPDRIVPNLISSTLLSHLPFFFFPWIHNPWYVIGAASIYMMLERGAKPAWMELLKRNLDSKDRESFFSKVATLSYLSSGFLPTFFGLLMDAEKGSWRWIFPAVSLVASFPIFLQKRVVIEKGEGEPEPAPPKPVRWVDHLKKPWQKSWSLLKEQREFRLFQIGFFLGGAGIMIMQPVLPEYFIKELHLSYTELALALTLCKGIGFALTSSSWAKWMQKVNIFSMGSTVSLIMILVALFMMGAKLFGALFYLAYIFYGVMQAGSELTWHLAGPVFSDKKDSSLFTSVSVVLVGVRGLFAPTLGLWIMSRYGTITPIATGALLCLLSTLYLSLHSRKKVTIETISTS